MNDIVSVTGSTGVLGRILVDKLRANSYEVNCFEGDIKNLSDINNWVSNTKPNAIFHFASIVPVDIVQENPFEAFEVNVIGTFNLIKSIYSLNLKPWGFFASSSHVYKSSDKPLKESSSLLSHTTYGETKYIAEKIIDYSMRYLNLDFCIGRIFSFYHKYQKPPFLYPSIMDRLKTHDFRMPFRIKGGNNIRDLMKAEEVVDIIIRLFEKKYNGVVNVGSGEGIRIKDFISTIIDQNIKIENIDNEKPSILVADITKLNRILNNV